MGWWKSSTPSQPTDEKKDDNASKDTSDAETSDDTNNEQPKLSERVKEMVHANKQTREQVDEEYKEAVQEIDDGIEGINEQRRELDNEEMELRESKRQLKKMQAETPPQLDSRESKLKREEEEHELQNIKFMNTGIPAAYYVHLI